MITSATANAGNYSQVSQAVRDFYSKEVMFQAQPHLRFLQFAKVKEDLTAIRGKSIVFVKYGNLDRGGQLEETDVLVPKGMSTSEVVITVKEQANAVQLTELLLRVSMLDIMGDASKMLANDLAITLDSQFRDVAIATTNVVFGNGKAVGTLTSTDKFNTVTVKDAVQVLANNNAPKIDGDYYVCFASPGQLRAMRDDSNWMEAHKYRGARQLYLGEVGMYEGVIFIETTQMQTLGATAANAKYGQAWAFSVTEGVVFGENAYAWAVALMPEMRDDGVVEMGRKHTIGWYGIWGMGLLEEKNIVRVVTAA